jgi:TonB-linked SusC/RagA family outer membrane protein
VLAGTGVIPVVTEGRTVMLVKQDGAEAPQSFPGWVIGNVVDSASGEPVANVLVRVKGTQLRGSTNERGQYQIREVPSGAQVITTRLLGYLPLEKEVAIMDNQPLRVDFALRHGLTRLQEVVTTATGRQRRLELGNDITIINADSIVRTQPITSLTDLLDGRVPGLVIQRTSGAPGDPSRLRLRGASSPRLSNDPIVIVDGVRVYAEQSNARSGNLAGSGPENYAAPSALDNIDPHSIETIQVLKGPSAATLYGQDAANGVIVVTTKRGQVGPPRWTVSAEQGVTQMPGDYPDLMIRWGHLLSDNTKVFCPNTNMAGGEGAACQADSLVTFQMLSDPALTVLDRGSHTGVALGVSGGSSALTYSLNGSYRDDVGLVELPSYEVERYRALHNNAPPDWMRRPQHLTQWGATSRMTAQLGSKADVSLTASLSRSEQQRSALEQQLGNLMSTYVDRGTGAYYERDAFTGLRIVGNPRTNYYERATAASTNFTNAANASWRPLSWLTLTGDAGLNVIQRADERFIPRGLDTGLDSIGKLGRGQGTSVVSTVDMRARAEAPIGAGFRLQFATGVNYTGQSIADLSGSVSNLADGTGSLNRRGEITNLSENLLDAATFGWYVAPSVSHKRFWLSTGLRLDGGNTFGTRLTLPIFPKLDLSYLISDEPFFPLKSVFNTFRLRGAYGQAGQQPGPTDRLRLYSAAAPVWVDGRFTDGIGLQTLGNTKLKPERSTEMEGGFDADLLDDRLTVGLTGYKKTTTDALVNVPVPPSVYGVGVTTIQNIGVIRNTGLEVSVGAQLLRTDRVTWGTQLSLSRQRNVVVELGPGVAPFYTDGGTFSGSGVRVAAGYPLFGQWTKPILGYADANGNGVIESEEVLLGDTLVYMGATLPNYTADIHSTLSLLRGAVSVTAGLRYEDGLTQRNAVAERLAPFSRGFNDPNASFAEQAAVAGGFEMTQYNQFQTVSTLRLNSLSIAYNVPGRLAQRVGARALTISAQGTNLGLRTNYRGLDPNVNARASGNSVIDTGVLPQPRVWQVRINANY